MHVAVGDGQFGLRWLLQAGTVQDVNVHVMVSQGELSRRV